MTSSWGNQLQMGDSIILKEPVMIQSQYKWISTICTEKYRQSARLDFFQGPLTQLSN
jgi:hypothetical protein